MKKLYKKYYIILPSVLILLTIVLMLFENSNHNDNIKDSNKINEILKSQNTILKYEEFKVNDLNLKSYLQNLIVNWNKIFDIFYLNLNKNKYVSFEEDFEIDESGKIKFPKIKVRFSKGNIEGIIKNFGDIIIEYCNEYKLDWRLILAIIHQESYFDSNAVSRAGAYGLMQLMPRTGLGLQNQLNLEDFKSAKNNLIAGIYYFATLVNSFESVGEDKYKFALAAYNAGFGRVVDVMTLAAYEEKNYKKWNEVKEYLPFLAAKYDTVYRNAFKIMGRQRSQYLNNWREPYLYVEYVYYYYERYKDIFQSNLKEKQTKEKQKGKQKKKKH